MGSFEELLEYVERRSRLAGSALIGGQNPYNIEIDELQRECAGRGASLVSFASYDYLGLASDPRVIDAACEAVKTFGAGVSASRVVGGERSIHRQFEQAMAAFVGHEDVLSTISGYGLNVSLIGHLLGSSDLLLVDELSHNSIMTGAELSRATMMSFKHNDLDHLEYLLGRFRSQHKRVLIVVEGLYSMEGDMPDLQRLIEIKKRFSAWLMIDEAHSIGVLGKHGRGLTEHAGVDPKEVEFIIGTLSKAFVSCGGFVCTNKEVIQWLRFTLPGFVYSVGAPPSVIASSMAVLDILNNEPSRVARLQMNSRHIASGAMARGLRIGTAAGVGIVPIMFSSKATAIKASMALLEQGIYIPPIVQQAVSHDNPRLRMFVSAAHDFGTIDDVLDKIAAVATALGERLAATESVISFKPQRVLKRA